MKGHGFKWNNLKETIFFCIWHSKMFRLMFRSCFEYFFACRTKLLEFKMLHYMFVFCFLYFEKSFLSCFSCILLMLNYFRYNTLKKRVLYSILSKNSLGKVKTVWWVTNIFSISFCYNGWFYCLTHHHWPLPINLSSLVFNG